MWPFISDKRIQHLSETLLCKPRGLSQRGLSMSQLCSTHHDLAATLYIPGVCVQWSVSGHNAGMQPVVLGTRYGILWPWHGQFAGWPKMGGSWDRTGKHDCMIRMMHGYDMGIHIRRMECIQWCVICKPEKTMKFHHKQSKNKHWKTQIEANHRIQLILLWHSKASVSLDFDF